MPEFHYYIDRKFIAWDREHYTVEAPNEAAAEEIIRQKFQNPLEDSDIEPHEIEDLLDSREDLSPEENDGKPTRELFRVEQGEEDTLLENNAPQNPTE